MTEIIKRYAGYLVALIAILFLANMCVNSAANKISGEVKILDRNFQSKLKEIDKKTADATKLFDSLHKDNDRIKQENLLLKQKNLALNNKLSEAKKARDNKIADSKNYSYKESAEFIASTYEMPTSIQYDDKGVKMTDNLPNKVVETIIENDYLGEALAFTEGKVENLELENSNLETENKNKDTEISTLNELGLLKDDTLDIAKELNEKQKKENKRLKTAGVIDKILIGAAFLGGFLIAR